MIELEVGQGLGIGGTEARCRRWSSSGWQNRRGSEPGDVAKIGLGSALTGLSALVQVFRDPPHEGAPYRDFDWFVGSDAIEGVWHAAATKAEKLEKPHWRYKEQTMLVATLMDVALDELEPHIDESLFHEWASLGFVEIWIAELEPNLLDAYGGDVRLYGLQPKKWWGLHDRRNPHRKPYG